MAIRRFPSIVVGTALVVAAVTVFLAMRSAPARSSQTAATPANVAKRLVGRWTGPKFGAEADAFREDRWQLVFERASRFALIGQKRHLENGDWSAFERVDAVVDAAGHIWAVDEDGTINGRLRADGTLELVYLEPGTSDAAAAVVVLRRAS